MALAPAHVVALALACFGLGLLVAAFAGESLGVVRLVLGILLLVAALITSGLTLLTRHGAPTKEET